jgi:signal transduction histidine kinase
VQRISCPEAVSEDPLEADVILVVDDEPAILETYRDYLVPPRAGAPRVRSSRLAPPPREPAAAPSYRVLLARSGEEAVELVRAELAAGGHVTCGFFDMRMPGGMDGLATIRRVRELDPRVLVAIVTAYQDRSFDELGPTFAGGHEDEWDYLNKPFTEPEIAQKARNLVASWHRRRREERYVAELSAVNRTLEERVAERTKALEQKARALEHALAELQRTQHQLVHKERLAAIGQLCAGLAHEINTPATYALLDIRHLLAAAAVPDAADLEVLRNAADGVQRIAEISRELRVFANDDEGEQVVLRVDAVLDRALRIANRPLHAQGDVILRRGPTPPVRGDADQLVQVLVTLLLNAVEALDPRRRASNVIVVTTEARGDHAVIRVADNGVGLPDAHLTRVFEPFFAQRSKGSGLGLSVARRLVEGHGGVITVSSEQGRGSAFEVLLPAAPLSEEPPAPPASAPILTRRLLLVDDDPNLLKSYQRWLGRHYEVETALGADAALTLLEQGEVFDAILCDVMMPEVSGLDLHRLIGERWPEQAARVIFVTGGVFTDEAQEALTRAARPCLFKPFDLDELETSLRDLRASAPAPEPPC